MNNKEKIINIIKDVKIANLITYDEKLTSRPMYTSQKDFDTKLFFFTLFDSDKVQDVIKSPDVLVNYTDNEGYNYVSINGDAKLSFNKDTMKKHWSLGKKAFFEQGLDTPGLCLIEVEISHMECWNSNKNTLTKAYEFSKGLMKGKTAELGEHFTENNLH
jgi:general stress protein 26